MKKRTGKLALALAALAMLVTTFGCKDPNNGIKTVEEETKSYTVTFNTNGGSAIEAVSVDEGNTLTLPDDPTKIGYDFKGWFTDEALSAEFDETVAITGDTTLYAKWAAISYTITYVLNDEKATNADSNPANYTIESADIVLEDPTTTNADKPHFAGWYSDAECTASFTNIPTGSTGNVTVYASWSDKNQYTVTFYDGKTVLGTQKVEEGSSIKTPSYTITGYEISGWYSDAALEKVFDLTGKIESNVALYAKKSVIKYTITYNLDGGTNAEANPAEYTVETAAITLAAPAKSGYTFAGWYKEAAFTTKVTEIAKGSTGNVTLYAKWEVIQTVATPVIGDVTSNTVAITCATEGATIYYTTDGTTPTTSSTVYKDSITFYVNSTIKAIAVKSGYTNSEVSSKDVEASYSISSYPISIPINGTNNYQVILSDVLPDDYSAKVGDTFKINFSGKSDTDLTNLQTFIVDNAEDTGNGWGWHLISDYKSFAESVSADTDFDYSVTFTITEDATGTGAGSHKIAIYYDLSVGKEAIIYKQGTDLSAIDTSKVILVEDKTYDFTTGDTEPWANAGKYGAQTVIHGWTGESFSCDDYSSITIEYEVFEGSQGLQLIVNSSEGETGTGWKTADDWSNKGSATIDLTAFKGKEFHWIAIATYLADASTAGSIKVNKIYLTKASE